MKKLNVLSLFDGLSCGRIALERAGIEIDNYYASEIDKYAIKVSEANYPDIIRLGDVTKVRIDKGRKIDLLIAGSPCQGFSFAGKQLNFDDPRSALFFEFVRILKECRRYNPDVLFMLENVKMKQEYQDVISEALGVKPIEINSALVSAQNRTRLYWTNIQKVMLPIDSGIVLSDVLDDDYNGLFVEDTVRNLRHERKISQKSLCCTATMYKGAGNNGMSLIRHTNGKLRCLTPIEAERLQNIPENYTNYVSNTQRYKMIGNGWNVNTIQHIFSHIKL